VFEHLAHVCGEARKKHTTDDQRGQDEAQQKFALNGVCLQFLTVIAQDGYYLIKWGSLLGGLIKGRGSHEQFIPFSCSGSGWCHQCGYVRPGLERIS
ncbi:hypothetical protein ADUPG1_005430, partial [Aduncisulcus paluster]